MPIVGLRANEAVLARIRPVKCVLDRSRTPGVGLGGGYLPKVASQPFGVS